MTLHLIPEPEEKASELLRDLTANDSNVIYMFNNMLLEGALGADSKRFDKGSGALKVRAPPNGKYSKGE